MADKKLLVVHLFSGSKLPQVYADHGQRTREGPLLKQLVAERFLCPTPNDPCDYELQTVDGDYELNDAYNLDLDKVEAGDVTEMKKQRDINDRTGLVLFLIMHDAEKNQLLFDHKQYQSAVRQLHESGLLKTTPILGDDRLQGIEPAYSAFARFRATRDKDKLPPYAVVQIEVPSGTRTQGAFETKVYPKFFGSDDQKHPVDAKMAQQIADGGSIALGPTVGHVPMHRLFLEIIGGELDVAEWLLGYTGQFDLSRNVSAFLRVNQNTLEGLRVLGNFRTQRDVYHDREVGRVDMADPQDRPLYPTQQELDLNRQIDKLHLLDLNSEERKLWSKEKGGLREEMDANGRTVGHLLHETARAVGSFVQERAEPESAIGRAIRSRMDAREAELVPEPSNLTAEEKDRLKQIRKRMNPKETREYYQSLAATVRARRAKEADEFLSKHSTRDEVELADLDDETGDRSLWPKKTSTLQKVFLLGGDPKTKFGCPYCGGTKKSDFGCAYNGTKEFGCPYCAKGKRVEDLIFKNSA